MRLQKEISLVAYVPSSGKTKPFRMRKSNVMAAQFGLKLLSTINDFT